MAHYNSDLPLHLSMSNSEHAIMTSDEDDEQAEHHLPPPPHGIQRPGMLRRSSLQPVASHSSTDGGYGRGSLDEEYDEKEDEEEPWVETAWLGAVNEVQTRSRLAIRFFTKTFSGWHYIYVVSVALLLSFILYPMKNMSYTDALFNAVSMATCTGLNATPVDELALYQSIVIYLVVSFSQPLFIHSSLIWFRLRLYEKKFDNINERARQQSKLRRAATRSASYARAGTNRRFSTITGRPLAQKNSASLVQGVTASAVQPDFRRQAENRQVVKSDHDAASTNSSSSSGGFFKATLRSNVVADSGPSTGGGVAFGDLPKPADHDAAHERTRNVYRSLNMLRDKSYVVDDDDNDEDDEGPALIIKSPQAIEADAARGIDSAVFTKDHGQTSSAGGGLTFQTSRPPRISASGDDAATTGAFNRHDTSASGLSQRSRLSSRRRRQSMSANYLSWQPTVGGNSAFVNLTREQKDELGGVEYRALKVLLYFIYAYHFCMILIAGIIMAIWCVCRSHYAEIIRRDGSSPAWFGFFMGMSAFNNLGLSLSPNSFADFQTTAFMPLFGAFFILFGDMLLPVGLRFCLWLTFRLTPRYGVLHESLGFLLDHPRRCFSLLFPRKTTWWLLIIVLLLASTDFILFIILDVNSKELAGIPTNYRVLSGFFQGLSVRKCGFSILTMTDLHPAILILYVIMMYISVLPVAISMRSSNVYEEQSLGVYYYPEEHEQLPSGGEQSALTKHLQRQLAHDLWYISLGLILLAICEGGPLQRDEISLFSVLFECVSGYGNSGASLGWPNTTLSLSGNFNTVGKLVMMGLMIRGRHRGLPYPVERAIILKDDDLRSRDQVQQNVVRETQTLQMPRAATDPENPWLTRIGTAASKIRREATTRLERAKTTQMPTLLRRQTIHESHPSAPRSAQARSDLSSNSSDGKRSDQSNSLHPPDMKAPIKRAHSLN